MTLLLPAPADGIDGLALKPSWAARLRQVITEGVDQLFKAGDFHFGRSQDSSVDLDHALLGLDRRSVRMRFRLQVGELRYVLRQVSLKAILSLLCLLEFGLCCLALFVRHGAP
ncbi:hypothetical protein OHU34_14070 [Streptomyces sp. NBC_00080]|uniref:hypothetical protein n=1 Tax=Streptomyces sp. NBC_00080 TaxID=2975645 RepID=UPI0032512628